jgi:isopropylmalate/homocitrate/citramalate synthase
MSEPWITPNWHVSPYNFDPAATGERQAPPILHDVTLRDGEESAGLVFSTDDKVALAKALDEAGLPRIELLLTTPGAEEATRQILDMGVKAKIYGAGGFIKPSNMEIAVRCKVRNITLGVRTSELQIKTFMDKPREEVLQQCLNAIETAKTHEMLVNLFLADAPRADLGFLEEVVNRCVAAGIDSVTVVDSVGTATPQTVAFLVKKMKAWCSLPVEVHTHNDFGLGMATSLAGWEAGAGVIHVAVNGLGYRCGNPATEEVVLALVALYGVDPGVKLDHLYQLSMLAQQASNLPVAFNKPLSGPGAFGYERFAELKRAYDMGSPEAFYPYNPEAVGREAILFLSKWSDTAMVKKKMADLGYNTLSKEQADEMLRLVIETAYKAKRPLNEQETLSIAQKVMA